MRFKVYLLVCLVRGICSVLEQHCPSVYVGAAPCGHLLMSEDVQAVLQMTAEYIRQHGKSCLNCIAVLFSPCVILHVNVS